MRKEGTPNNEIPLESPDRARTRKPEPEPEPVPEGPKIDITTPRECIYQNFQGQPGRCPRCNNSPLQQSYQQYLIATRRGKQIADSFIIGSDIGWFCTQCPTVVINPDEVSEFLQHSLLGWDVVPGLVTC